MYPSLVLSAALIAPAAPIPRDAVPDAPSPPPCVLAVKADPNGNVRISGYIPVKQTVNTTVWVLGNNNQPEQKQVEQDILTQEYFNKTLADCNAKFSTAEGIPLSLIEATARVKNGAVMLASSDGKPISKTWLRAAAKDTVVMIGEDFSHFQPYWGGNQMPSTPAPRLTMLATDEKGRLLAPCTSEPLNGNVYYYNEWGGAKRERLRGRGGYYGYGELPPDAKVELKPLADVQFEAYDQTGKRLPRGETLKRLAAGGMVLVAGDNQIPDAAYLKGLHPDVPVLVGSELVLPATAVDKTKKKDEKEKNKEKEQPAQQLPIIPAIGGK